MRDKTEQDGVLHSDYADERARKKELGFRFRVRGEAVVWAVRRFLEKSSHLELLEMGSADGRTLKHIDDTLHLQKGVGIEFNPELIRKAEDFPTYLRLLQGDVTNLEGVDDSSMDIVTALALLEHLTDPLAAVRQAARVLRPGGLFIATSPVPFWDHLSTRLGLLAEDIHECDMHPKYFREIFAQVDGLELIHFQRFMWAPIGLLPYFGVSVSPQKAFALDCAIEKWRLTNFLFVNQLAVVMKT